MSQPSTAAPFLMMFQMTSHPVPAAGALHLLHSMKLMSRRLWEGQSIYFENSIGCIESYLLEMKVAKLPTKCCSLKR